MNKHVPEDGVKTQQPESLIEAEGEVVDYQEICVSYVTNKDIGLDNAEL